jgi:PAS domain S-box-containing protein
MHWKRSEVQSASRCLSHGLLGRPSRQGFLGCRALSILTILFVVILGSVQPLPVPAADGPFVPVRPQRITVVDDQAYAPFSFLDANGQPAGITIDIWELWSRKTGIQVDYQVMQWDAALQQVRTGHADAVGGLFVTDERRRFFTFSQPFLTLTTSLFFHEQISGVRGLEDIQGFPVGVVVDDSAIELIRSRFADAQILEYPDVATLVEAAVRGTVKVFVADGETGRFYLAKFDQREVIREAARPVAVNELVAAVRKDNPHLLAVIQEGFNRITPREISQIKAIWGGSKHRAHFSRDELVVYGGAILAILGAIVLWNVQLRRTVARSLEEVERRNREVQESEHRFTQLFNSAPVPMAFVSEADGFWGTTWNDAWYQAFGYPREVAHGRSGTDIGLWVTPEDRQRTIDLTHELQGVSCHQALLRRYDGTHRLCSLYSRFIGNAGHRLLMFVYLDITESKAAEEALRQSESRFSKAFALSPAPMVISDIRTGRFIDVNEQWLRMLGYSREETIGQTSFAQRIWEDPQVRVRLGRVLSERGSFLNEPVRFVTRTGAVRDALWSAVVINLGGAEAMLSLIQDDTERKQAEDALRASESYNKVLFHDSHIPLAVIDPDSATFMDANQAAVRIYGFTDRQQLLGKEPKDLSPPTQRDGRSSATLARELLQRVAVEGALVFEWRHLRPDGSEWDSEVHLMSFRHRNRRLIQLSLQDITGRKQAERERLKLQDQLLQSQKMESIGRLAGGVAHDFNNMLSVIVGHAELGLGRTKPGEPLYTDLRSILEAARRSADLTRQLLAFARKQTVTPRVLDMNETLAGMLKMLRRLIGEDIELDWQPGVDVGRINMDPSQLDQLLVNLCVNARDALQGTGKIMIKTGNATLDREFCRTHGEGEPGEYVLLTVRDNGGGIVPELLPHLFEPFFTTKGMGKGTGLGLATVYGIVKQNNGMIRIESTPGQGTAFHLYLPRSRGKREQSHESPVLLAPAAGSATILLVEDETMILEIAQTMLEMQGYHVLAAATPGEALGLAREHAGDIDLLMTDVVMPEMNGRDLARQMVSLYPNIKRLFMSGYTADVIAHHGVLDEGVHFLQKPFTLETLTAKVRGALENTDDPGDELSPERESP